MISFQEYLIESRMAPLYHVAPIMPNALSIIKENKIRAVTYHRHDRANRSGKGYKDVVSLTRSFRFAKARGQGKSPISRYAIFELDQQKLNYNYKLIPYNHFQDERYNDTKGAARELNDIRGVGTPIPGFPINQYEENVIGDIKGLRKYLTKIYISLPEDKQLIRDELGGSDIPIEVIK